MITSGCSRCEQPELKIYSQMFGKIFHNSDRFRSRLVRYFTAVIHSSDVKDRSDVLLFLSALSIKRGIACIMLVSVIPEIVLP